MSIQKPDFFIVGAPKSGTTSLYEYLRVHPEIYLPSQKELNYFGKDLKFNHFDRSFERYLNHFKDRQEEKMAGEASVWSLFSKEAAKEIADFNPDARIIIMLRKPVDLLYSLHSQLCFSGGEDIEGFSQALDAEADRRVGKRIPRTAFAVHALFYREIPKFAEQISRYLEVFPHNQVHVILFDDFKNNTTRIYKETLTYLGVNPELAVDFKIHNPNKSVRFKWLRDIIKVPPPFIKSTGRLLVPGGVRSKFMQTARALNDTLNRKEKKRIPLDESLKRSLETEFHGEISSLGKLLKKDLTAWL
jgi:hypothetical protein